MTAFDPRSQFPDFYGNHAIAALGEHRLWTVSDAEKRPIDVRNTLQRMQAPAGKPCSRCGREDCSDIHGAQLTKSNEQLLTLPELTEQMPRAANAAVHLDTVTMGFMVLDIEPNCPPELTDQLLRLATGNSASPQPVALYSELSCSGRGYHLVMPVPNVASTIPGLLGRTKIQHPERWYEVLFHHWITFSRNPIPEHRLEAARLNPDGDLVTWDAVLAQLEQIVPARISSLGDEIDPERIAEAAASELSEVEKTALAQVVAEHKEHWNKDLASEFRGDTSRWEYSQATSLARTVHRAHDRAALSDLLSAGKFAQPEPISDDRRAVLTYLALLQVLPHRDKHEQFRSGIPYLLKRATSAVADTDPGSPAP